MAKQPKYVQLEAEAFLADFMGMTAEERGCYATIIFHLYKMHGRCIFDKYELAALCNLTDLEFDKVWRRIGKKFAIKSSKLFHKRVSKELHRARVLMQVRSRAGLKGAETRWQTHSKAIAKGNVNVNVNVKENITNTNTKRKPSAATNTLRKLTFNEALISIIKPRNQSDRTCFRNITNWLMAGCSNGRFNGEIFDRVLDYAREASAARKPAAVLLHLLKNELEYRPPGKP
ncbi:MAG TPA: DUF1376 domain-containing protein [Williamwhitmania sp.]|nr:DUF1376 domain-containing protein [Williamwhitmania sp.]